MIIERHREKLLNAIIYFVGNTEYCHKIKLFKLLYFLDFDHFKQTGRSSTGTEYSAWPKGPVPRDLYYEFRSPNPDMEEIMTVEGASEGGRLDIRPKVEFDPTHFSRRELNIMEGLAAEYRTTLADNMIEASHLENQPWHKVFEEEKRRDAIIPYEYVLRLDEDVEMLKAIRESKEVRENWMG